MKRKVSIFALILLFVCMLPIALNIPLVQADPGGIGKFLTVEIVGEGYVTAFKVKSGETWDFPPSTTEKVGAGTVLLTAIASEGWDFSQWGGDLTGSENPTNYQTQKYGYVAAVFIQETFTITVTAVGDGDVFLDGEIVSGDVFVEYGATPEFTFDPYDGNYISSVAVNGSCLSSFVSSYTFPPVTTDQTLDVFFSLEGTATVPPGPNVYVHLDPSENIMFSDAGGGGTATVDDLEEIADYPVGTLAAAWIIDVDFTFSGEVLITLQYDPGDLTEDEQKNLRLIRGETLEALRSDVNRDLVVDSTDTSIVAEGKNQPYDPRLDLNNDGEITNADIFIVNENKGTILVDITVGEVNTVHHIIQGITDHFSIFGVH